VPLGRGTGVPRVTSRKAYHPRMSARPHLALILIAFLAFISLGLPDAVNGVAWPSVRTTFGLPVSHLALLAAAGTCGYLVSSFSSGAVVRRLGVGRLLLVSGLLGAGASLGYALAPAWPVMVALGVCSGLGAGAIDAGINAYAARHFSPRLVNWLHAFYGVGATLGPLLMTLVLSTGLGWRWGYGVNAILLTGMSACFLLTLKLWETPVQSVAAAPLGEAAVGADVARAPRTLQLLRRPVVMLSVIQFFLYTGLEVTAGLWTYSLFTEARGIKPAVAGAWVSVFWASLTVGRIAFGTAAAHVSPLLMLRAVMCVAPLGALFVWANVSPLASFLGLALLGLCLAPVFPLLISLTPARVGRDAADHVIGFQVSAACLGAAGVPGLTGLLTTWRGLEVVGPVLLFVAVSLLVLHEVK
jgi:fucose permease